MLEGKRGLIIGAANSHSIAFGCAAHAKANGAETVVAYGHPKALDFLTPHAEAISSHPLALVDVDDDRQIIELFDNAASCLGSIDFVIHSVAFAPANDLHGPLVDASREGFLTAMSISAYSFVAVANQAKRFMQNGGSLCTMSYYGAEKFVNNYGLMGPVKAALESTVSYLAHDLGEQNIRVNALSPGPVKTRAASGLNHFDDLLRQSNSRAPLSHELNIERIGAVSSFLASDDAINISGEVIHVDNGFHAMA